MLTFYIVLVAATLVLCLLGEEIKQNRWLYLLVCGVALVVLAGLKSSEVSVDSHFYHNFYKAAMPFVTMFTSPGAFFSAEKVEPSFLLICSILKSFLTPTYGYAALILIFAILAVSLKLKCMLDYTEFAFFSLFLYVCYYFQLHELIQIRAGLAIGIVMYSFRYIVRRDFWHYLLFILLAVMCHYSTILFLPFYFVSLRKINPWIYVSVMVVPFVLMLAEADLFSLLSNMDLGVYSEKVAHYQLEQKVNQHQVDPMNMVILTQLGVSIFLLCFRRDLPDRNPYAVLFLKICMVSVGAFYVCFSVPVFAFRTWQMLNSVSIFLFPCIIYYLKPRWLAELLLVLIGLGMFYSLASQAGHLLPFKLVQF